MKTLLAKSNRYYIAIALLVFLAGGGIVFFTLKNILNEEVTENLLLEKMHIEKDFKNLSDTMPIRLFYNEKFTIHSAPFNTQAQTSIKDTLIADSLENEEVMYRMLRFPLTIKERNYTVTIKASLTENDELMEGIVIAMLVIFLLFVASYYFINRWVDKTLWKPFYKTLLKLKNFEASRNSTLEFEPTDTKEFFELNEGLTQMSKKINSDFNNIKEFTENASHEIQTPLSVITNKLENLIQSESLNEQHVEVIQIVYEAAIRLSRLNKSLLLVAKIENGQFLQKEEINLNKLITQLLLVYDELIKIKKITLTINFEEELIILMNPSLSEMLISNILTNAIFHNIDNGAIDIKISGKKLSVINDGHTVFEPVEEQEVRFKKNRRSKDSLGLGLSLIKKIALNAGFNVAYSYSETKHTTVINFHQA